MSYNNDLSTCMSTSKFAQTSTQVRTYTARGANAEAIAQLGHKAPTGERPWERIRKCTTNGYYTGK